MENKFNLFTQEFTNQYWSAAGSPNIPDKVLWFFGSDQNTPPGT